MIFFKNLISIYNIHRSIQYETEARLQHNAETKKARMNLKHFPELSHFYDTRMLAKISPALVIMRKQNVNQFKQKRFIKIV